MTLLQMQYFKAVCQYGSVSKAAESIHISQPSISIAIKDLESELGVALFTRQSKNLRLTQEGSFFYERVSILLNEVEALTLQMRNMGSQSNQLNLAIPIFFAEQFFSRYFTAFSNANPHVTLNVKQCNFPGALKMLEDGGGDCAAIVTYNNNIPANYMCQTILSTSFVYCVSPDHPLASCESVDFPRLCSEPLILNQDASYMTTQVKKRFYDLGLVPNVFLYAMQLSLIRELVSAGKAGTFLAREIAESLPDVKAIPIEPKLPLDYVLIWKRENSMNRNIKAFVDFLTDSMPQPQLPKQGAP